MRSSQVRIRTQAVLLSVVPLTFLIVLFVIASVLQTKTDQTATWSQRSTNTLKQSEQIAKSIGDANSSVVEYTTKKPVPASLAGYHAAVNGLPAQVAELRRLVADEPGQDARAVRYGRGRGRPHGRLDPVCHGVGKRARRRRRRPRSRRRGRGKIVDEFTAARHDFEETERVRALSRYDALHRDFGCRSAGCCSRRRSPASS